MPDPEPANTKISMEMNSASAALSASGWLASLGVPNAILLIGILLNLSLFSTFAQARSSVFYLEAVLLPFFLSNSYSRVTLSLYIHLK